LQPTAEVRDYVTNVAASLGVRGARLDVTNDPNGRRFRIMSSGNRWQVSSGTDEVLALASEINVLRRQIEHLQTELGRFAPPE
jgi:hypothetical protein